MIGPDDPTGPVPEDHPVTRPALLASRALDLPSLAPLLELQVPPSGGPEAEPSAGFERAVTTVKVGGTAACLATPRDPGRMRLGDHVVLGQLGAGGMGEVMQVEDPRLGRIVAAKVMRTGRGPGDRGAFIREARITGQLEHPNIVPVYALDEDARGQPFFTMKEIHGVDLRTLIAERTRKSPVQWLSIFQKICDGIAYAHSHGVIHRDLKPANVLVGAFGEVYVCDWGLAKALGTAPDLVPAGSAPDDRDDTKALTREGTVFGTAAYMPPEQARGEIDRIDVRSDIYSLGAVLYQMLTGRAPYLGQSWEEIIERVLAGTLVPPSALNPHITRELDFVVLKAMAYDPAHRYATVGELQADIQAYLEGRPLALVDYSTWTRLAKWAGRHRLLVRSAAAAVLATLVASGYWKHQSLRMEREAQATRAEHVALVRAHAEGLNPLGLIEEAGRIALDVDPARRVLPPPGRLTELAALVDRLQVASQAVAELVRLDEGAPGPRRCWYALLLALGRTAEARLEDAFAKQVYAQAATLGVDDAGARALADRAGAAPAARQAQRLGRIEAHLAQARAGELADERAYLRAVAELASFREQQTVDALIAVVDHGAGTLRESVRVLLATDGDAELARAVDASLDPDAPEPTSERRALLDHALDRLVASYPIQPGKRTPSAGEIVGFHQARVLGSGGQRTLALACEALSLLDDPRAVPALVRLAWATGSPAHAVPPVIALATLANRSTEAERATFALLGLGGRDSTSGRARYPHDALLLEQVRRVLKRDTTDASSSILRSADEWFEHAEACRARGDLTRAIAAYTAVLELDARHVPALTNRALSRDKARDLAGAIADLSRAIELAPDAAAAYAHRGNMRLAQRELDLAIADYDRALELCPDDAEVLVSRGRARLLAYDFERALADLTRALDRKPDVAVAHAYRGLARARRGDPKGAVVDATRAMELDPRSAAVHTAVGSTYDTIRDLDLAIAAFDKAIELDPACAEAFAGRGISRQRKSDFDGAIDDATRALELDPLDYTTRVHRGITRALKGDLAGALADLDRSLELAPRNYHAYAQRGIVRVKLGNRTEALADFDQAIALNPRSSFTYANRGQLRVELGDLDHAIEDFTRAVELNPRDCSPYCSRGFARLQQGDHTGAIADFTRAIEAEPRSFEGYFARGTTHVKRGDHALALSDLTRVLEIDPRNWKAYVYTGNALESLGRRDEAVRAYERGMALAPEADRLAIAEFLRTLKAR